MIVDARSLAVMPIADEVLRAVAGDYVGEVEHEDIDWSNELVLHVIELKTSGPAPRLEGLTGRFQEHVGKIGRLLQPMGARLMPAGMHPWMDPHRETRLWPHEYNAVYEAFDRIFSCRGHGWSNLQSVHLNLPFAGDEEFGRLHAAIRLVLPILPALAASSPVMDGRITGTLDNRLAVYRTNCAKIPSLTGRVIPEPVFTPGDYDTHILQRCYRDLAPHDPEGLLQEEFVNARGAIARFCRNTIEIRVLDVQECPQADLAICAAIIAALQALVDERWGSWSGQQAWPIAPLEQILLATIRDGDQAVISNPEYLQALGMCGVQACSAGELWAHLAESTVFKSSARAEFRSALEVTLREGSLARRILNALGPEPKRERLGEVYAELCDCLHAGRMFRPG